MRTFHVVLVFAYDGSLNGDWVAHYAIRFAANVPGRHLRLVHVEGSSPVPQLQERIARIADECAVLGVTLEPAVVHGAGADVESRLAERVPPGATLVAGTRAKPRRRAYLAGSVSSRLLRDASFPVVAIHVAHPGVLGQPGRVLLPVAGRPRAGAHVLPLLRLLGSDLRRLHLLVVRSPSRLGIDDAGRRLDEGRALAASLEDELRTALAPHAFAIDSTVVIADDTAREILLHAGRCQSRLICLGASERTLSQRVLSGNPIEEVLRDARSDVAVYRSGA